MSRDCGECFALQAGDRAPLHAKQFPRANRTPADESIHPFLPYASEHRLYDGITANAPEYYLFPDELNLLKCHGDGIARSMGFPGKRKPEKRVPLFEPEKPWRPARWGDVDVGKWNNGVNGEQGLGGGWERGYDVVELGAG